MTPQAAQLTALVDRCEGDLGSTATTRIEGDALAEQVGGELALRWGICVIRSLIADPPDGDAVREAYGELLDRHREDPAQLATLKALGDEIRQLERDGTLPSAMVARSDRRKR